MNPLWKRDEMGSVSIKIPPLPTLLLGLHFCVWLGVSLGLDIHPDMADHWLWSKYLSWGYYEHPPLVALTMWPVNLFGAPPILALKVGSVLFSVFILYLAYQLARLVFAEKTAWFYLLILESTVYFSFGSVFWHIDQPYMACWLLGLMVLVAWSRSQDHRLILLFGFLAGLGALSKYIMVLLPVSMVVWLVLSKPARVLLKRPETYLGGLIALGILSPNLYWNAQHEWITFSYNFQKGLSGANPSRHFIAFQSSQILLFSLPLAASFWFLWGRGRLKALQGWRNQEPALLLLKLTGVVPFLFFSYAATQGRGADPHWINISYYSFFLFLAHHWSQSFSKQRAQGVFSFALAWNGLLVGLLLWQVLLNPLQLKPKQNLPFAKVTHWRETATQIEARLREYHLPPPRYVISREYHLSSSLALYLSFQPWTHSLEKPIRNLWSPRDQVIRAGGLLVCPDYECESVVRAAVAELGRQPKPLGMVETRGKGFVLRRLELYFFKAAL